MRSSSLTAALVAALASLVAAKDGRTFAVLHFHGDGPLTIGRSDPIVNPGVTSSHVHVVQGGNAFGNSATGASMMESTCSTANIVGDKSAYWMPSLYFHDVANNSFEPVPLFYMNVYYFFEATNDDIKAFPVGLQMVSGNATRKTPPATGNNVLDPSKGAVQPAQFTCPRSSFEPPSYPAGSDGTMAGIQDTGNKGSGAGFPFAECDGYASPLRADLHFPSCYNPAAALTDFRTNAVFPSDAGGGKQDCPPGWLHMPHLFFEMYWNTPLFKDRWTPNQGSQPFVLSNGDAAGYSLHGDFLAAWDTDVLQHIIDTCDAGDAGMDKCPGVATQLKGNCNIPNPSPETIDGVLAALPGNNPLFGWQYGTGSAGTANNAAAAGTASTSAAGTTTSKAAAGTTSKAAAGTTSKAAAGTTSKAAAGTTSTSAAGTTTSKAAGTTTSEAAAVTTSTASVDTPAVRVNAASDAPSDSASGTTTTTTTSTETVTETRSTSTTSKPTTSASTTSASTGAATTSASTSAGRHGGGHCRPARPESTTTVTVPVTVYTTATSTVYLTTHTATAEAASASGSASVASGGALSTGGLARRGSRGHGGADLLRRHVHGPRH